jgi:hypothetical protein
MRLRHYGRGMLKSFLRFELRLLPQSCDALKEAAVENHLLKVEGEKIRSCLR